MTFPVNPKDGRIFKHSNGLTYVYEAATKAWDICHDMVPMTVMQPERKALPSGGK